MSDLYFVLTGPSGAGKTIYSNLLYDNYMDSCEHNITYTTRKPRPEESHAKFFKFVSQDEFNNLMHKGHFICSTEFCGNYYAYMKKDLLGKTKDFIIDSIMKPEDLKRIGENVAIVYLTTSTNQELYERIRNRNSNMDQVELSLRIQNFSEQISLASNCDYIVCTDATRNRNSIYADLAKIYREIKKAIRNGDHIYPSSLERFRITDLIINNLPSDTICI